MTSLRLVFVFCLLSLFIFASAQAQVTPGKVPTLNEAKTFADVDAYLNSEAEKLNLGSLALKERAAALAGLLMPVSEKLLLIAKDTSEKGQAYSMKFAALANLMQAEIAGADQKMEIFLKELAVKEEFMDMAEVYQFRYLLLQVDIKGIEAVASKLETYLKELAAKETNKRRESYLLNGRFLLFAKKAEVAAATPANFAQFKAELKTWITEEPHMFDMIALTGFEIAYKHKVPAEQFVKELSEYIQSPDCKSPADTKTEMITELEMMARLALGADPKLYGKTIDDKDFDWKTLRGKYVLVKFTATWCGPCKMEIPGMLEAYKKYHDKGLEIVSVYIFDRVADPVPLIKEMVEEEKLPWIILSEALTEKAGQQPHGASYGLSSVPTMVLVDKEGKIMMVEARGPDLKTKLAEIFE